MRYEDVAELLPGIVDGSIEVDAATMAFIESDLRCQAELARYRRLLRGLEALRHRYLEPPAGALASTLAHLAEAGERRARRSLLTGRKAAYAGIGGAAAVAAGAAVAVVVVRRRLLAA